LNLLAIWFPNSRFVGIDLLQEAIEFGRVEAEQRGNKNASFIARDPSRFDQQAQPGTFDLSPPSMPFTTKPALETSCAAFGSRWLTTASTWRRTSKPRVMSNTSKDAMVVVDRGMANPESLATIKAAGYHWLVAAPQPERLLF